jgi:tetratricopeptide (TPR) repeat protein
MPNNPEQSEQNDAELADTLHGNAEENNVEKESRISRFARLLCSWTLRRFLVLLSGDTNSRRPQFWRLATAVITALSILMLAVGIYDRFFTEEKIEPMQAALNVAVPAFTATGPLDEDALKSAETGLATGAADNLQQFLIDLGTERGLQRSVFLVWGPDSVKFEETPADEIAQLINADVVITSQINYDGITTSVNPEFYFSGRKLIDADAEELIGYHRLGPSVTSVGKPGGVFVQTELLAALATHWEVAGQMVLGLDYYASGRIEQASELFHQAIDVSSGWVDPSGTEVLHLYLANTHIKLGDNPRAQISYERALEINSGYARAQVGLAETVFQLSRNGCRSDEIDEAGVRSAIALFGSAAEPSLDQPLTELQQARASLLTARVYLCLFAAGLEPPELALEQFEATVKAFEGQQELSTRELARWGDLAAESWASIAAIQSFVNPPDLDAAALAYESAIELSAVASRRAIYHLNLASIMLTNQDCGAAEDEIKQGLAIYIPPEPVFETRLGRLRTQWTDVSCSGAMPGAGIG